MIFQKHDYNLRGPVPVEVADKPIHDFMRWIIETNAWRDQPELVMDKLIRLRKNLLDSALPVPATIEEDDEPLGEDVEDVEVEE